MTKMPIRMSQSGSYQANSDMYESPDLTSLIEDNVDDATMRHEATQQIYTANIDLGNDDHVPECFPGRHSDIDTLSDKFDSIGIEKEAQPCGARFDAFEVSAISCVDIDGSAVQCRGPCIDVRKVYKKDEDGDTLLHIALIILAPELAFYFIDLSPTFTWLNIQNKLSQSPLHLATLTNQVSLVRRLIVGGADVESRDRDGNMAIHLACRDNLVNVLRAILTPVRYEEQKRNNYDIPFKSIPQNLDVKNYEGLTGLHIAGASNHMEIVQMLLDCGADVNAKAEKTGRTILHEAAWNGNDKLVKFLISLGVRCNINVKSYDGYTAFDLARSRGHWSIVIELATAGAKYADELDDMQ